MARKLLKRYLPRPDEIKQYQAMQYLGARIHDPNLWHLNRRSVATAVAIGVFLAFLPIFGQMLVAAIAALYLRGNIAVAVLTVWISNPITFPPILYANYTVGSWLMMEPALALDHEQFSLSWEWLKSEISLLWRPLLLGSFVLGTVSSALSYFLVRYLWRWHALQAWKERREMRKARKS